MKLYFTPQTLKKIIKLLLLFILISIIIFYTKTLNVQAKEYNYFLNTNSSYRYYNGSYLQKEISDLSIYPKGRFYLNDFSDNRISFQWFNFTARLTDYVPNTTTYASAIYHVVYDYDISLVKNFSIASRIVANDTNLSSFTESDMYITIDDDETYLYHEIIVVNLENLSIDPYSPEFSSGVSMKDSVHLMENFEFMGTIPRGNSYVELNKLIISDEPIILTLNDYVDDSGLIHYNPNDVTFPSDNEDDDDSLISRIIKNIINGIKDFGREVWIDIKTAFKMIFVPSSAYFNARYESLKIIFNQKFGIFIAPIDIFINFIERFLTLTSEDTSNFVINVPEYKIPGFDIPILKKQSYNLSEVLNNGSINRLWTLYLDFIDCFMIISFLNFSWNKLSSFFGGMSSDNTYYSVDDIETYNKETGERISSNVRFRTSRQVRRKN